MSEYLVKSLIAVGLLLSGTVAFLSMMTLMGRTERQPDPAKIRRIHGVFGYLFILVLIPLVLYGLHFLSEMGDALPLRGVLHVVLAFTLLAIIFLKILVVRFYRQFLKLAPTLGMSVFVLSGVVFLMTAGFFFLRSVSAGSLDESENVTPAASLSGRPAEGAKLFQENCLSCHHLEGEDRGTGPDLRGVFKKEALPVSGRPPLPGNIIRQLREPLGTMPAFLHLTRQEVDDLLAYLLNI